MNLQPCSQCDRLSVSYCKPSAFLDQFRTKFFHDPCITCDSGEDGAALVCEVCKHLRLQHLVSCSRRWIFGVIGGQSPNTLDDDRRLVSEMWGSGHHPPSEIEIELGTFTEIRARSSCNFCSGIAKLAILRWQSQDLKKDSWDEYIVTTHASHSINGNSSLYIAARHPTNPYFVMEFYPFQTPNSKPTYTFESMSKDQIDWSQFKNHIEESVAKHEWKSKRPLILPDGFRVIDVERDKVVLSPDYCQYVALSYVWGEITTALMLRTDNVQQLAKDFSISRTDLPATIRDAMVVCAKIGQRYLWVDCLCIVQDGHEDIKQAQIEKMGDIYSFAFLTIVGASGDDARSGLAGIDGKPRLKAPHFIHFNNMVLTERLESPFHDETLTTPKWYTRGWTYQELLLSSRLLIFTEFGLCYQYAYEDELSSIFEFTPTTFTSLQHRGGDVDSRGIRSMIQEYTKRHLTNDTDTFRAISGVFNYLGVVHQSGIPVEGFSTNILWQPSSWQQGSRTHDSSGTVFFPSWSWGSVIGPVRFDFTNRHHYDAPVAAWAHFSEGEGSFNLLPLRNQYQGLHDLAHQEGMFSLECSDLAHKEGMLSPDGLHDLRSRQCEKCCVECRRYNTSGRYTYPQMCAERRVSTLLKKYSDEDINVAKVPGHLLLLTQTARLRLEYLHSNGEGSAKNFFLWDENAQWLGALQLSEYHAKPVIQVLKDFPTTFFDIAAISISDGHRVSRLLYGFYEAFKYPTLRGTEPLCSEDKYSLFCGSSGSVPDWGRFFQEVKHESYYPFHHIRRPELYHYPVLNVMLLGWRGKIAHRIGLGQVWVKRWVQSNPKSRAIVLE
jgi:hypothetical protein